MQFEKSHRRTPLIARCAIWLMVIGASCLEPYPPPPGVENLNLLVVDGFLNSASGLAQIRLSRSIPLDAIHGYPQESGAVVEVEDEQGEKFTIPEQSPGLYSLTINNLQVGKRYHLMVRTSDDKRYESDPVMLKKSPVLDSVHWMREGDGITIKVDSHDASGSTQYYQWFYTETWEYDADKNSAWIVRNGRPRYRRADEWINICYSTRQSTKIFVSTTADQTADVIRDFPLVHIAAGSKKVCRTYTILVQQRALDEDGYNYWRQLAKNTEDLGTLFDHLPGEVHGNIHASDPYEKTLGYFSGSAVEEQRIYIQHRELPEELQFVTRRVCIDEVVDAFESYPDGTPLISEFRIGLPLDKNEPTYICMDCRLEGGTVTKPSWWPN
jgi:hypothetical protein